MNRPKILGGLALASMMLVVLTGCPGMIGNVVGSNESVDKALKEAQPGDTVEVEGTVKEEDGEVDVTTDGVTITGGDDGGTIDSKVTVDGNNVTIENITITGTLDTNPGSFQNLTLNNVTVQAWNNATVSGTFSCTHVVQPGGNIQTAINNSNSGDNVCVAPDTYTGALQINKDGLTLKSFAGASNTTVEADLANQGGSPKLVVVDAARNVTIDGFTLRDSKPNTTAKGTVHAVRVLATSGGDDASGFKLTNSIIEDLNAQDRVRAVAVNVIKGGSGGDSVGNANNPTITDNVFRNLVVDGDALANDDSGESGNRVVGVGLNGGFSGAEVSNNEFKDFSISPRSTDNTNKCIIHAVELSEDKVGTKEGPTDFSITSNTFDNFDSCENTVNGEKVSAIGIFIGSLNSLGNHEISRNNFSFDKGTSPTLGAGVDGGLAGEQVDATNNWWGDPDGPSAESIGPNPPRFNDVQGAEDGGSGVLVSTNVDFSNPATSPF